MSVKRKVTVPDGRSGVVAIVPKAGRTGPVRESYPGRSSNSRSGQVSNAAPGADRACGFTLLGAIASPPLPKVAAATGAVSQRLGKHGAGGGEGHSSLLVHETWVGQVPLAQTRMAVQVGLGPQFSVVVP